MALTDIKIPGYKHPVQKYVYLVEDVSDAIRMGGTPENTYITAQAAYNAADALSAGGTIPVVILVGKTSAAVVGGITITGLFWNSSVGLKGLSAHESVIGSIILDNAAGNSATMGNFWASDITINQISALATGVLGDGPTALNLSISGTNISNGILMGTNNPGNTGAFGGNLTISFYEGLSKNNIGDILVTPGSNNTWGNIDITSDVIITNFNITTGLGGGVVNIGRLVTIIGDLRINNTAGVGTILTVADDSYVSNIDFNVFGASSMSLQKCRVATILAQTTGGTLDVTMEGAIVEQSFVGINAQLVGKNCQFGDLTLANNSRLYNSVINNRILSIGTGCYLINCSILSSLGGASISNPTAVTVIGDGTYWTNAPASTVTVTNAVSVIPTTRYVYLVQDAADRIKMGDRHDNVYTTFQAAYDAANALQVALGGTNFVVILIGNTTAAAVGNLTLTANYNFRVRLCGIDKNNSNVGNIVATNAAGNGFSVGSGAQRAFFSNVSLLGISTNATGATGNSGEIGINLNNANILGTCTTAITNVANTTGNGGNVFFFGTSTAGSFTVNTINTRSQPSATALSGNITISGTSAASPSTVGLLQTANNSNGGIISVTNVETVGNVTFLGIVGSTANISFTNVKNVGNISASMDDGRSITITRCGTGNITVNNIGALVTPISVTISDSIIGTYTASDVLAATLTMRNTHSTGNITNLTSRSQIYNCIIDGGITGIEQGVFNPSFVGLLIENTTINTTGLVYAIDNAFPFPGLVYIKSRNNSFNGQLRSVFLVDTVDMSIGGTINTLPGSPNFVWDLSITESAYLIVSAATNYTLTIPYNGVSLGKRYVLWIQWTAGAGGSFTLPAPRKTPGATVYAPPVGVARLDRLEFEFDGTTFWYVTPTLNYLQY